MASLGQQCVHCGTDCGNDPVIWEQKPFCCHGCKMVYQILNEKKLNQYYEIQPMPGIRIELGRENKKFEFLDHPEIQDDILFFRDGTTAGVRLFIPGIHCASCIWLLEHLNTLHPGILHSQVNFPRKEVSITFKTDQISLRQVAELLSMIHYVPEITLENLRGDQKVKSNRLLLIKMGVAGFGFMNIMMYSFPEYLPGGHLLEQEFKHVFGWLSFLLILPVVFFSGNDYFISAWKSLKHKIISIDMPITLGILALFFQSSFEVFSGNGLGYMDSLAGLIFFLLIGKWYQGKTYQALSFERDYKSYFPVAVTRLIGTTEEITPIKQLRRGDLILVRNQELIPADAFMVSGEGNIDYAFISGESFPVSKRAGDFIYAGGRQIGSSIVLEVKEEVEQSYLTQLWNQKSEKDHSSNLRNTINNVSQYFTAIVLAIALTAFFAWWQTAGLATAVYVFASVLIIACPCALALTIPFTFGSTMRVFGRKGFYIKNVDVIESLFRTSTVVFDKTGTITLNRDMQIDFHGQDLDAHVCSMIRSVVRHSSHPMSDAIHAHLKAYNTYEALDFEEVPGMGITANVEGSRVNIGSGAFVLGMDEADTAAESRVYVSIDRRVLGYFSLSNRYRDGLSALIHELRQHYTLHLLTGDNNAEEGRLREMFGHDAALYFNQSPTDKRAYIQSLREAGDKVLMVGDGLNDAGALAESDTGISIADDVFSFSPACDAILEAAQFRYLDRLLSFTRTSFKVIRQSFFISFLYNVVGISFAVSALLSPLIAAILMPLSSVSVVAFASLSISYRAKRKLKFD